MQYQTIENQYRTISVNSRKINNNIKSAAEKTILYLHNFRKNQSSNDNISLLSENSPILLEPILLSFKSNDNTLTTTAITTVQILFSHKAISNVKQNFDSNNSNILKGFHSSCDRFIEIISP